MRDHPKEKDNFIRARRYIGVRDDDVTPELDEAIWRGLESRPTAHPFDVADDVKRRLGLSE